MLKLAMLRGSIGRRNFLFRKIDAGFNMHPQTYQRVCKLVYSPRELARKRTNG